MNSTGKKIIVFFLALLVGLVFVKPLLAERLPVRIYTSADGLGSSFVDYLMRDSRGFMWFCTRDGLSRFDGSRFITYQIGDEASPPGIESIYQARDGTYWISTTGGTYRFDLNEITKPDPVKPRINAEFITGGRGLFFEDSAGTLYLTSGTFARIVKKDGKYVLEDIPLDLPPRANTTLTIADIGETKDGSLWLNSSWGLIRRLPDSRLVFYPADNYFSGGNSSMIVDKSGRIWVSMLNSLLVLKPEPLEAFAASGNLTIKSIEPTTKITLKPEGTFSLPKTGGEIIQFSSETINSFVENSYAKRIYQTSDGDVWVSAEDKLLQFSNSGFHLHSRSEGLPNVMSRMEEDSAGNLWIGGFAGLARLDRQGLVTFGTEDGANSTRFFAINEDSDGTIYAVGRDFYLNRFDGEKFKAVQPLVDLESQFLWTSRFGLRTSNGDWWILTNKRLYRFAGITDFSQLDKRQATQTFTSADGLKSDGMFQIFEDSEGSIWVSTRGRGNDSIGVARLKKGETKFHAFTEAEGLPTGKAASAYVTDSYGNIWLGFYEGGLAKFDGERFEFFGKNNGLPTGVITDLHVDGKGRLWIGSAISGLLRIDDTSAKTPSFVYLSTANGLTSNNVRTITEDRFGRIYIGTASGVDRISPDTGHVKHYSVNDGLAADFVVDSHCDKKGDLWFATNDGLSRLSPLPDEKTAAPQVFIGGLRIAGLEQPISQFGNAEIDKGELAHTDNNFQIDFFGLDFRAGETLRYQYKLEGADADWSQPTEIRTVTFANLQPADYRFLVRAVNSDGTASENPAIISFKILSPFWQRWWFILLCAVLVSGAIILLYRYRITNLREINAALTDAKNAEADLRKSKEERLAELEKVRSRIATDLHDDIGASLTQIAVLSEVAQAQSKGNGATEPLTRISNVSNELVEAMSDIVWSINPAKDHLSDLTQRMRRFASDILAAKGIAFHFDAPHADQEITVSTNLRREVFLLFKESVNNIVKHSGAKHVEIELKIADGNLKLKIADNGKGFTIATNGAIQPDDYGGNGILSMKKRALEMNGKVEITSEIGKGTTVDLTLPLEQFSTV
ncbi:MAG TPA: two-component regulator propeller domain-containing protein [Pyrinomonadaceae bacterium]|nr:two-component regulator propeller domain-containing protein [Pyrinomonadaceae bacterium]